MFKTIGIGGQLYSGKDALADYLAMRLGEIVQSEWKRVAFANGVKEVFEQAFGYSRGWIEEWKRIDQPPPGFDKNVRQCLIGIGDGFRLMKANVWIERVFNNQKSHQIISDIRYTNESNHVRSKGGISILLWRKGHENDLPNASEQQVMPYVHKCLSTQSYYSLDTDWKPFEGEIGPAMDIPFDMFIRNEGTLDELYQKAENIIIPFLKQRWKELF